jgi:glutamate synthase (ferredoxin)
VATQNAWLMHGLDPTLKAARCANYIKTLRRDLLKVSEAVGVAHPALITADDIDLIDGLLSSRPLREVYGCGRHWGTVEPPAAAEITRIMAELAPEDHQRPA